ncbi:non-hydrolyzing UDP-N-acetylglucosamine 2-epimerase [Halobium salinum]|uniref:Non-hydrolyzing UDP-N-acetylglucosamine 2-epimerase n=1 Tax=Halobium salinum TaxID=1364940 RepID=A0ABD5PA94_9EURY|nr:UDP-N-acetylglucosamine 2-epimerase (non-hydrolyzing) [Halobium salinum]
MKVLSVVGARPQFIKAFPVSRALADAGHEEVLVHTGQHYDEEMSDVFFEELGIPEPAYNLGVGSDGHVQQTARMMTGLADLVEEEEPDCLLVYGDTNSTLAGALVAVQTNRGLVHVEAGLRSGNRDMPEETNRILTDHVSDVLCAPTAEAVRNLEAEGLEERTVNTGDVMYDAALWARDQAREHSDVLDRLELDDGGYVLATVHRAANTDDPARLEAILEGLASVDEPVVLPAHPRTKSRLEEYDLWDLATEYLRVVEPVGYLDFVRLLDGADRVATDSGGVQKEAFFLRTPCVTLREETEWVETVEAGGNVLVGADTEAIEAALARTDWSYGGGEPYGDGNAAAAVADSLSRL